ncbi:MAG: hypothetical protein EZS28_010738 [Streblomastix strix]|uniref:Uncharacterized protein n=1 Tax=Streblomastix strix TaxID=222440 RepID=A0A5J4WH97_9EUKA|nr:MAG: hypothetical protein EZS28_010738 [Streblomastix strix]
MDTWTGCKIIHPTNLLHHTFNIIHSYPYWKKHQLFYQQFPPEIHEDTEKKEPESKQLKLQQQAGLMDVVERLHEIMKPIIEEKKEETQNHVNRIEQRISEQRWPSFLLSIQELSPNTNTQTQNTLISRKSNVINLMETGWIHQYTPQIYKYIPDAAIRLIEFAVEEIIELETESKDEDQLTNEQERIIAEGTDDNGDEEQSELAIEPKELINGNDGLKKNKSGTQLQATGNGETNLEINITKISANPPRYNINGSDVL